MGSARSPWRRRRHRCCAGCVLALHLDDGGARRRPVFADAFCLDVLLRHRSQRPVVSTGRLERAGRFGLIVVVARVVADAHDQHIRYPVDVESTSPRHLIAVRVDGSGPVSGLGRRPRVRPDSHAGSRNGAAGPDRRVAGDPGRDLVLRRRSQRQRPGRRVFGLPVRGLGRARLARQRDLDRNGRVGHAAPTRPADRPGRAVGERQRRRIGVGQRDFGQRRRVGHAERVDGEPAARRAARELERARRRGSRPGRFGGARQRRRRPRSTRSRCRTSPSSWRAPGAATSVQVAFATTGGSSDAPTQRPWTRA